MPTLRLQLPPPDGRVVECRPEASGVSVIGRHPTSDIVLEDPRVSARHLAVFASDPRGSAWFVRDLHSRHGVTVNGGRVSPGAPTPLQPGDLIGAGPIMLRVLGSASPAPSSIPTLDDGTMSRAVAPSPVVLGLAELKDLARLSAAESRGELAAELIACALGLTGYPRAAVVQAVGTNLGTVELVASRSASPSLETPGPRGALSRSLLSAALANRVAVVDGGLGVAGQSLIASKVHSACCVRLGEGSQSSAGLVWMLYLDAKSDESPPRPDATDVASALSSVASACLGRLMAAELHARHAGLERELARAREVQRMLLPESTGTLAGGQLRYEVLSLPGQVVAGDLVDVADLGDGRAALIIGDVMGKGAPAGMLMSAIQARLSQGLADGVAVETLVTRLNRDLLRRCPGMIASLWVGIVDAARGTLRYVNAGHGLCVARDLTGRVRSMDGRGGPILGADELATYGPGQTAFARGDRLVLFTDGLPEQPDASATMLGLPEVLRCIEGCADSTHQAAALRVLLERHASGGDGGGKGAGASRMDDVTVLVVDWCEGSGTP